MHNFAKLSPMSQTFISRLQAGNATNIAAARAVANKLPLPSFEVTSVQDHYQSTVEDGARKLVSDLNEIVMINARDVLTMVETFWKVRYFTVFPPKTLMPMASNCISNFMGFGAQLPQGMIEDIKCGGESIVRSLNGFTTIICELTETDPTKANNEVSQYSTAVPQAI